MTSSIISEKWTPETSLNSSGTSSYHQRVQSATSPMTSSMVDRSSEPTSSEYATSASPMTSSMVDRSSEPTSSEYATSSITPETSLNSSGTSSYYRRVSSATSPMTSSMVDQSTMTSSEYATSTDS